MSWPQFRDLLQRRRQIKALLLDQTLLAGLGNIYADESLFKARILEPQDNNARIELCRADLRAAVAGGFNLESYLMLKMGQFILVTVLSY